MGHIHLETLPDTQRWKQVFSLISDGADVDRVAAASAAAAEHELERASQDDGVAYAFWLLTEILRAALHADFSERLWKLGLTGVSGKSTLFEIVAAFTRAVDKHVGRSGKRTDWGEMAQHAASETLTCLAGRNLPRLFEPTPADVQQALAKLCTRDRFNVVFRDFFSRLTSRSLNYFLSRELSNHVGPNKRFLTIEAHSHFKTALDLHCRAASRVINGYSFRWWMQTVRLPILATREQARQFAYVAFKELRAELRKRRDADG